MKIDKNTTLGELQEYIWRMNIECGFEQQSPDKKLVLLMEEVGELAKAVRKISGMGFSDTTETKDTA